MNAPVPREAPWWQNYPRSIFHKIINWFSILCDYVIRSHCVISTKKSLKYIVHCNVYCFTTSGNINLVDARDSHGKHKGTLRRTWKHHYAETQVGGRRQSCAPKCHKTANRCAGGEQPNRSGTILIHKKTWKINIFKMKGKSLQIEHHRRNMSDELSILS